MAAVAPAALLFRPVGRCRDRRQASLGVSAYMRQRRSTLMPASRAASRKEISPVAISIAMPLGVGLWLPEFYVNTRPVELVRIAPIPPYVHTRKSHFRGNCVVWVYFRRWVQRWPMRV